MIREDLLEFQYYLNRLSKFMQESYGINEQVETFFGLLKRVNEYYDEYFKELNFFKYDEYDENPGLLDQIGTLFACKRNFTIPVYDPTDPLKIIGYENINLNNNDYLIYIKCQIIKQNFDGGRETLQKLYSTFLNGVNHEGILKDLYFLYTTDENTSAKCTIRWNAENPSENLKKLFLNGFLTIESMGIMYSRYIENFNKFMYFEKQFAELVISEPSPFDPTEYYKISSTQPTSTWDGTKIYAKFTDGIYEIISNEPVNWNEIYNQCVILEQGTPGDPWAANTYYQITSTSIDNTFYQEKYIRLATEPADWPKNCYSISETSATATDWNSNNNYAEKDINDYIIIGKEPVNWIDEIYNGKYILNISEVPEATSFVADTYYQKQTIGGILI